MPFIKSLFVAVLTFFTVSVFATFLPTKGPIDLVLEFHDQMESSLEIDLTWVSVEDRSEAKVKVTEKGILDDSIAESVTIYFIKLNQDSSEYFIDESQTQKYDICYEGRHTKNGCM